MTSRLRPVHFRWWLWFLLSLPFLPLASVMAADIAVDANCSLHDAIKSANWDSAIGGCSAGDGIDRIHLSQDITLTASLPEISNMVSIYGKGHTISAAKQFQHFSVEEDTTLWLNNVVLTNSHGTSIYNRGQLIIRDSLIRDNGDGENSGVIISFGDLTIRNSTILENQIRRNAVISASGEARIEDSIISSNSGPAVKGGRTLWIRDRTISGNGSDDTTRSAIEMGSGFLSMDNSTVSDNLGGGVHIRGGSTFIYNSSITGNKRPYDGGGIHLHNVRFAEITNSTISGNQAVGNGGGIAVSGDTDVSLQHVTLANNIAESGGGMYHSEGSIKLLNSIISGNQPLDCLAILEQNSGSLIADGTCVPPFSGDPLLQPLTDIPAFHLLMDGSQAIGNADAEHCLEDDQRGMQRPMPEDGACDIGAIESRAGAAAEPTPAPAVCTLADQIRAFNADESVGACPAGDGHDTITLSDFDMTYSYLKLESELPAITSEITIEGGGNLIGGQSERRIFLVDGGKLTINDLSLYDGYAVKGGAVYVTGGGSLFIQGSRICRNLAQEDGGGIYAEGSSFVAIYNSTICDNEADDYANGGGIYIAEESTLEVRNSDFLDNDGNDEGGAIYSDGSSVTIRKSTFSGNRSGIAGGAIAAADSSSLTIASSAFHQELSRFLWRRYHC